MKFYNWLNEFKDIDSGQTGKKFEKQLMKAFDLLDMKYEKNKGRGKFFDIKTIGDKWIKLIGNQTVNIKVSKTKWLFGSAEIGKLIPWDDELTDDQIEKLQKKVENFIKSNRINDVYFLRPKDKDIENQIIDSVKNKDIKTLNKLMIKKNFHFEKLGNKFDVNITKKKDNKVGYISIKKDDKIFMHSEPPRKVGGSKNFIAFRTTPSLLKNQKDKRIKK